MNVTTLLYVTNHVKENLKVLVSKPTKVATDDVGLIKELRSTIMTYFVIIIFQINQLAEVET